MPHAALIRLLGAPHVEIDGRPAADLPARTFALVAVLGLEFDDMAERSALASRLWEESPPQQAAGSLRMLLMQVRRWEARHGVVLFKSDTRRIWRDSDCAPSDVSGLLAQLGVEPGRLAQLLSLCRGPLLENTDLAGADLAAWIAARGEQINRHFVRLFVPAALNDGGAAGEAALRKALEISPYNDEAVRALLLLLGRDGAHDAVRREYRAFEARLRSDLDTQPEPETRELVAQLTQGRVGAPAAAASPGAAPAVAPPAESVGVPRVLIVPPPPPHFPIDPARQNLANALIDDVTITLCKMRSFAVLAPHTARQIARGTAMFDPHARDVAYTLSTRLLSSQSGALRLGLSLMRNATGEVLLGDDLLLASDDLASRHAELASMVVRKVVSKIERTELKTFRRTGSASAYVHYLLGSEHMHVVELKDLRRARAAFKRALALEPEFTPALSMMARTLTLEWLIMGRQERDLLAEARALARRAIEIDPFEASGHRELGHVALYEKDLDQSLEHLRSAHARSPHHADLLIDEADALVHHARARDALPIVALALGLNPLPPDEYYWTSAAAHYFVGEYQSALDVILKMKRIEPASRLAAASAAMAGNLELARYYRDKVMARHPGLGIDDWNSLLPFPARQDRERYREGLRQAGFK